MGLIIADMVTQFTLNANKLHCYSDFNAQEKPTKFMLRHSITCPRGEFLIRLLWVEEKNQRVHVLYLENFKIVPQVPQESFKIFPNVRFWY